ncbi:uncharacterized protein LOC135072291 [Ostrinia nubilalis]|uniref:uncharacterized protein LOC114351079 n=1 Tax=Ostrinia furnacalis TaxID=93504 RepID=UPI00103FC140|nr:uncharacterized protein LOC114351079 [Ostrinia furnacalis]
MKDDINFSILLIKEIELNPCLYDLSHPNYNVNWQEKEAIWTQIGTKLGESGTDCKNKWKVIRTNYIRSMIMKAKGATNHKKDYYLSPHLSFLNPFVKQKFMPNPNEDSMDSIILDDNENQLKVTNTNIPPIEHNNGKRNISEVHKEDTQNLKKAKKEYQYPVDHFIVKRAKDEYEDQMAIHKEPSEMYLLSLAPHIKTMTPRQQLKFQIGVAELIDNIKYGDMT